MRIRTRYLEAVSPPRTSPARSIQLLVAALALLVACKSSSSSAVAPILPPGDPSPYDAGVPADPREPILAAVVGHLLSTEHLEAHPVDDTVSRKAFAVYLEDVDPGKLFLLQPDVAALREHSDRMDDEMREGYLALAHETDKILASRIPVVAAAVAERLKKPFDFTRDETLQTDGEKLTYCATEEELSDRWRKNLKLEVLARTALMEEMLEARKKAAKGDTPKSDEPPDAGVYPVEPIPDTVEGREKKARADLAKKYEGRFARLAKSEPLDRISLFLNAITSAYDPHTNYFAPANQDNFDIEISGSLEGIGAVLSEDDHYIRVVRVVPGGASWRQGELEAGDLIMTVAQAGEEAVDVGDMRLDNVVEMIRGPKGTVVTLTIQKPNGEVKVLSITRDVVEIEAAYARAALIRRPGIKQVGYIDLPSFYGESTVRHSAGTERSSAVDVARILAAFTKRNVGAVIVDLRGNGGGLLDDARLMSGLFIETGPIVQTRTREGKITVLSDNDPRVFFDGPVVVLVDRFSASASEILAAALQDYRRAVIVGPGPTHGKGTVQVVADLDRLGPASKLTSRLGMLKLTREQYFRISGGSVQWHGVQPDVPLPDPYSYIESGERFLDNAIPWSKVKPLEYEPWRKGSWNPDALAALSKKRVAASPVFAKVEKWTKLLQAQRDDTVVDLDRGDWDKERESDRKALDDASLDLTEGPERFKVLVVSYTGKHEEKPADTPEKRAGAKEIEKRWLERVARDPWIEESLAVLHDMTAAP